MKLKLKFASVTLLFAMSNILISQAQSVPAGIHGNFQSDVQYYRVDSSIGAPIVPQKVLTNGFANINYTNNNFSCGLRYESYLNVLQGYDARFKGNGILYRYAQYNKDNLDVTVGSFYEQFGSGMILRSYEERGLGYDNAFDGVRVKYNPTPGLYMKGFIARQRAYFDYGPGIVRGFDTELNFAELMPKASEKGWQLSLGGSFVSKYQKDEDALKKLPENVGAFSTRANLGYKGFTFNAEYAYKYNDPSAVNTFIYKEGQSFLTSFGYTKKGLGINLTAKRIDNMDYRSDRTETVSTVLINFMPAIARQYTYRLLTLYPYATQPMGEMGAMAELYYTFKPNTGLGGKTGMYMAINSTYVNNLKATPDTNGYGYTSNFLAIGKEHYYADVNVELTKKLSKKAKITLNYVYIEYNKNVLEGKLDYGVIYSHTGILDFTYKFNHTKSIRTELQHLYTKQDLGSWAMALVEFSMAPHWSVAAFAEYNYGNKKPDDRFFYPNVSSTYVHNSNRFSLSYGKQRAGLLCVGGVCRFVPASNGVSFTVSSSF